MFSLINGGIKQVSGGLFNNKSLGKLVLWVVTNITNEDVTHLSNLLASDTTLKELYLSNCNVTDKGV